MDFIVGGADAEMVGHNRIDGGGLTEGPLNCRGVIASQVRCLPCRGGTDEAEDGLLEDHLRQFWVHVGDGTFRVSEADQLLGGVGWSLDVPGVFLDVFVGVYTYPLQIPVLKCWRD